MDGEGVPDAFSKAFPADSSGFRLDLDWGLRPALPPEDPESSSDPAAADSVGRGLSSVGADQGSVTDTVGCGTLYVGAGDAVWTLTVGFGT